MRWFGKKLDDPSTTTVTVNSGTQVKVGADGSLTISGPDTAKLMEAVKQASLGPTVPDTDLSKAIAEIAAKFQGHAPDEAVPALKAALSAHGHDVPDEWVALIAQTITRGGTTNLSFGNWSSTAH